MMMSNFIDTLEVQNGEKLSSFLIELFIPHLYFSHLKYGEIN